MNKFLTHIQSLSQTENDLALWQHFFSKCSDHDKMIVLQICLDNKLHKLVNSVQLKMLVQEYTRLPLWIIEASQRKVKDSIETLSLLLPRNDNVGSVTLKDLCNTIRILKTKTKVEQKYYILETWRTLSFNQYYLFNRIVTGVKLQEVKLEYLEKALAQYFDLNICWIRYCLKFKFDQQLNFNTLFKLDKNASSNLPNRFEVVNENQQVVPMQDYHFVELLAGKRVQIINSATSIIAWSEENRIIDKFDYFLESVHKDLTFPFIIEGEIIAVKNEVKFSLWKVHEADDLNTELIKHHFKTKWFQFANKKQLSTFQTKSLSSGAGLIGINRTNNHYVLMPPPRKYFNAVLMYAQKRMGTKQFDSITFGLRSASGQSISIGKLKWSAIDTELSEELRLWILTNKSERIGPIVVVPEHYVFALSCSYINRSARHKSGFKVHDIALEKSQFMDDLTQITAVSFLAENALES